MAQVDFPETLLEHVRAQSCILCTGVRFSMAAGMPDWEKLFETMKAELDGEDEDLEQLLEDGKLLTVAGYLKRKLGPEYCTTALQEAYAGEGDPPESYEALKGVPFLGAITTGYDTLLEKVLTRNEAPLSVYTYADGPALRVNDQLKDFIIKAHGDVEHSVPLVLTSTDYRQSISPNQAYRAVIEDLYRSQTLLLVGFHRNDPDLILFLERLLGACREPISDHYAILPGISEPEAEELYANYRLKVISYEEREDPAESLTEVVGALCEEWKTKQEDLPGPDDPEQQVQWIRQQLAPVDVRLDVTASEGLQLSEKRLNAIRSSAENVELDQLDAESLCRLGNVHLILEDIPKALMCYEMALSADGEMSVAHLNTHHACAETGRFEDALEHLTKAVELDPSMRVIPERYELEAIIGRGTTGTIYKAQDSEEEHDVVVKVLRSSFVREHVSPELWLQETENLKALEHDNISQVNEVLIEGGRCILITEYLEGKSLSTLLKEKGSLPPDAAMLIMNQVCAGLQHAHEQDILHLDITPANIFIKEDGTAVLMDFRTGRAQQGRAVHIKRGSEGFQAPELMTGAGGDVRTDVYSLGAVLYSVLTGKVPIGSFPKVGDLVPAARRFDSLVTRSLRAQPDERPQTVEQFAHTLEGTGDEVDLPERADDLEGWLEVLSYQPENEQALENLDKMEAAFNEEKDWDTLIALHLGRVEVETDPKGREKILRKVAQIFEHEVGDLGKAFAALLAAFREDSANIEIRQDLERLAGATGMWNDLLQEYNTQVQTISDVKVQCDWLVRMGRLYANELHYDDYALASFNQAVAMDAQRVDALEELVEVLRRKEEFKELTKVISKLVEMEEDTTRKIELLTEFAQVQLKELEGDEEAVSSFCKILEMDPTHAAAAAALQGLYQKSEDWEKLSGLLHDRLDQAEVAEEQREVRHSLAEVLADKLDKQNEAIEHYQELVSADPDDLRALKGLEKLFNATGRNDEYMAILDKRIAAVPTDEEKVKLCQRMAAEWEEQEGGQAHAAEYLEKIVEINGGDDTTFKSLVRLYWAVPDYPMLAEAYKRNIELIAKPEDRAPLLIGLGMVQTDHLEDDAAAMEIYNDLVAVEPENKVGLAALAKLAEKTGDWEKAVEMLERLCPLEEAIEAQADAFQRIGSIQHRHLDRAEDAEVNLVKALELNDSHVEAHLSLAGLYQAQKDFGKAARNLTEAARHTTNELDKVKHFFQAAVTYQDDLEDEENALAVFEELIAEDPEHVESGHRLAAIYEQREDLDKAAAVLEMLVRKVDPKDKESVIDLNLRLGNVAQAIDRGDRAREAYREAYDGDPTNQETLQKLADLLFEQETLDEAAKLYQSLLVHRRDSMSADETVRVFFRLGDIKERQDEKNKALNMYEKALDLEPGNKEVLERAIGLYEAKDDLDAVLRCKKSLLDRAEDDQQRMDIAEGIGDLLREKLKRPEDAVKHYEIAREIEPDQRRVLNKIMEVYIEQRQWDQAIKAMGKIEDYEQSPKHRSRLHYTAAVIFRDELKQLDDAIHHFDQALLKDPTFHKPFEALKKLYTQHENYKALAKAYHIMLQRLPEKTPKKEQAKLWTELGEICHTKLMDAGEAIVAYEVADKLDPTSEEGKERLAFLYAGAGPEAYERAVAVNHRLLENNPMRLGAYKELRRLYTEMGQMDKAWCVCAVLALLKKASDDELGLYKKFRSAKPRRVARQLTDDLWRKCIYHGRQSDTLNAVFAAAAPVVAPMAARAPSSYGLKAGERLSPVEDTRVYSQVAGYVGEVLGVAPDRMHLHGELSELLSVVLVGNADERSTVLRVSPRVITSDSETSLCYWFGRSYALLRPEHFLYFVTRSATVLQAIALACLKVADPSTPLEGDTTEVENLAAALKSGLRPEALDFISTRAKELRQVSTLEAIQDWMKGVECSISRAALALADDLETAAMLLSAEPEASGLGPKERAQDLLTYAVSEPYFKLREHLGLSIR